MTGLQVLLVSGRAVVRALAQCQGRVTGSLWRRRLASSWLRRWATNYRSWTLQSPASLLFVAHPLQSTLFIDWSKSLLTSSLFLSCSLFPPTVCNTHHRSDIHHSISGRRFISLFRSLRRLSALIDAHATTFALPPPSFSNFPSHPPRAHLGG